ncbi:MAG: alanine--glyoxylate aminotransferase family protein [Chloroflexi bacterium]|nr:alanine--glyoxylate aminotransferase family protein [Chloroflexota bacterium]
MKATHTLPRHKLMIPGPVEVDDSVLAEMGAPVAVHYGPEWTAFYKDTTARMKQVFRTSGDVFLIVSSGSGGVEAAVASLLAPGERVLVAVNGFFGERMATIAQSRGLEVVRATALWGEPIAPEAVRAVFERQPGIAGLLVVHHETSTGVLNPLPALGSLAREFDVPFVVDAVSSLGGEELAMDDWGIDICITASQKCLEAPPGIAPVAVSPRAWHIMDRKGDFPAGWYLNLRALRAALDRLLAEGLAHRIERYQDTARFLRAGLRELGFSLFVDGEAASSTITAVCRPPQIDVADLIAYLREARGIRIAGGLGETHGRIFRVGHMGQAASREYAGLFLEGLTEYLHQIVR